MKKIILLMLAGLLLNGCWKDDAGSDGAGFSNMNLYCQMGDNVYTNDFDNMVLNGALDTTISLCRDPLCTHEDYNSTCPESQWFFAQKYFQTDGERIFMYVHDLRIDNEYRAETGNNASFRVIYSFEPMDQEMRQVAEFETTGQMVGIPFVVDGDYVYFKQTRYLDADAKTDEVFRIMRVKKTGSVPEEVLARDIPVNTTFAVSGSRIFLCGLDDGGVCEMIETATGESVVFFPDGKQVEQICVIDGEVYLLCSGTVRTDSDGWDFTSTDVYRMEEDGSFTLIAEDSWNVRFSGGYLWVSPASLTYYGTVEMPTGHGNETEMVDIYDRDTGELVRIDLETGERRTWKGDKHIGFLGYSAGYALANLTDYEYAASGEMEAGEGDHTIYKLTLNDDGTVTIAGQLRRLKDETAYFIGSGVISACFLPRKRRFVQ